MKYSYPLFVKDVENLCNHMSINGIRSAFFVPEQRFDQCRELIDVHSIVPAKNILDLKTLKISKLTRPYQMI